MTYVWENSKAKGSELLLLLSIADHAADDGYCWPTIETLAEKIRMRERSVIRLIKELEAYGELCVIRSHKNNRYMVIMGRNIDEIEKALNKRKEDLGDNLSRENLSRDTDVTQIGDTCDTQIGDTDVTLIINKPSIEPLIHGDEKTSPDETEKQKRKPSAKNQTRKDLEQHFSDLTGLPVPKKDTQGQRKSAGSLWWSPIREMAELCEWNRERSMQLMDLTVAHLKKSGMTVSSPKSIVNTAKAVATGNVPGVKFKNNGSPPARKTEMRRIQDPFTKEWREQEVRL